MRATRRRTRKPDPLANPAAVERILQLLCDRVPADIPSSAHALTQLLVAIRHRETYGGTQSRRGRPSRFDQGQIRRVGDALKTILERETKGRISLRTFIDHYLHIPEFPADLIAALTDQRINLFEAEQLARLTAATLKTSARKAERTRGEMLKTHLAVQESGARLRLRINELLGKQQPAENPTAVAAPQVAYSNIEFEEILTEPDPTHIFYDQMQQISLTMSELSAEDLSNEMLEEVLHLSDQLLNALARARKRQKTRSQLSI
jgi:hypothetical protein